MPRLLLEHAGHVGLAARQVCIGIGSNIPTMKVMKEHYGVYSAARPCYLRWDDFFRSSIYLNLVRDIKSASSLNCPSSLIIREPERGLGWCCHRPVSSLWVREGTKTGGGDFSSQDRRGKPLFFFFKSSSIRGCSLEKFDKKFWFEIDHKRK